MMLAGVGTAMYAAATWNDGRYADRPMPDLRASSDPAVIARGRYLVYGAAHCVDCHTTSEAVASVEAGQEVPIAGGYDFGLPFGHLYSPNLTPDKETGIGRWSDGQLARMIRYNIRPNGRAAVPFMQFAGLSDGDLVAVLSYLRAQAPVKHAVPEPKLNVMGKMIVAFMLRPNVLEKPALKIAPTAAPTVERGEYLVNSIAECAGCHTRRSNQDGSFTGPRLGGGNTDGAESDPTIRLTAPNLTSDSTGITGKWSEDRFVARFHAGKLVPATYMPWSAFRKMTDDDIRAIYRYIRTVPPVKNATPSVQHADK